MLVFPPEIIFWVEEVEVVSYCTAWAPQLSALQQSYSPTISELCSADSDTPEWHTVLTHESDTQSWHTGVTHRSDTPEPAMGPTDSGDPTRMRISTISSLARQIQAQSTGHRQLERNYNGSPCSRTEVCFLLLSKLNIKLLQRETVPSF